ncbi:transcription initiation factor TFIID subunit 4-like isoform X2 [Takifugu flavidus]|uniref:transcription initiation factor TFIID subunit 4-like isoform X2 n=1 Tax=Takifugu flavidus TaxID=433684 RepID=UPI002544BFC6|nr:transcription initiation factor TFIID subunit 4-like isoform X2 [Takifugu flavidus]
MRPITWTVGKSCQSQHTGETRGWFPGPHRQFSSIEPSMADKVGAEPKKLEPRGGATGFADPSVQFKILQFPAKCAAKVLPTVEAQPPSAAAGSAPGLQTTSPSIVVISKAAPPAASTKGQPQITKAVVSQVPSMNQLTTLGRTVMITVPRSAAPQALALTPQMPQSTSSHQANLQIPPGMILIRSESGQLMLVSQQALTQTQRGPSSVSGQMSRVLGQQVSAAVANKGGEQMTVLRMALPASSTFQSTAVQKSAVVKVVGVASKAATQSEGAVSSQGNLPPLQTTETAKEPAAMFSPETLESVKKCKNFLVTLIKLASSDAQAASMASNVRGLVRALLEGKIEAEQFTERLYQELKSTPQPCLVPFLKKSLPAVRHLTVDPHLFIQQASAFTPTTTNSPSPTIKQSNTDKNLSTTQQLVQQPGGEAVKPRPTLPLLGNSTAKNSRLDYKIPVAHSGKHLTGTFPMKLPLRQDASQMTTPAFRDGFGTYREDDDINDVASMAGVNLGEENAQILTSMVGSVVQSCHDQLFLSPNLLLNQILHAGRPLGVTDVSPDVVALISHATQERLHGLVLRLTVLAGHRKAAVKEGPWHTKVSDVRSQLRFLEEVETLKKKRNDEEERERLLLLARSRSHSEDPQHQQLKQRAKELQQIEEAQMQKREANLTALAAIGPRRKRPLEQPESQVAVLPRPGLQRGTRITLRDLLLCMELDPFLCHSLLLYKAML